MYLFNHNKPAKKIKAVEGGTIKWIVTIKQWIHQGFTYLDHTEMFWRVIWEFIPFVFCFTILYWAFNFKLWIVILISFLISHTFNWIFNYNFWTCIDFTFPFVHNPGNEATIKYLSEMQQRMMKNDVITGCMIYGSMSRAVWHNKSDLDIRIMGKPGFINGFKIYWIVFKERLIAVRKKQPLDLYQADSIQFLKRMRVDEFPIFLKCTDERLIDFYKNGKVEPANFKKIKHLNELGRKVDSNNQ